MASESGSTAAHQLMPQDGFVSLSFLTDWPRFVLFFARRVPLWQAFHLNHGFIWPNMTSLGYWPTCKPWNAYPLPVHPLSMKNRRRRRKRKKKTVEETFLMTRLSLEALKINFVTHTPVYLRRLFWNARWWRWRCVRKTIGRASATVDLFKPLDHWTEPTDFGLHMVKQVWIVLMSFS